MSVQDYANLFRQQIVHVPEMHENDRIRWFHAGPCHVKSWLLLNHGYGLVIRLEAIIAGWLHCALF
eukprot:1082125-Pelagomonas_calceolata.AAC.1